MVFLGPGGEGEGVGSPGPAFQSPITGMCGDAAELV